MKARKWILIDNQECLVTDWEYENLVSHREWLSNLSVDDPVYAEAWKDYREKLCAIEGHNDHRKKFLDIFSYS